MAGHPHIQSKDCCVDLFCGRGFGSYVPCLQATFRGSRVDFSVEFESAGEVSRCKVALK